MNHTFNVVFSRVRGCTVTVNEITHSFQKKSTKAVVTAIATAALLGFGAQVEASYSGGSKNTPTTNDYGNTGVSGTSHVVEIEGEEINGDVYGVYQESLEKPVEIKGNKVTVKNSTINKSVFGTRLGTIRDFNGSGDSSPVASNTTIAASNNNVTILNSSQGPRTDTSASLQVNLNGVYGALIAIANDKEHTVSGSEAKAENNTVTIDDKSEFTACAIYGAKVLFGTAQSPYAKDPKASVKNNHVIISGNTKIASAESDNDSGIFGGYARSIGLDSATAAAEENKVEISNSKIDFSKYFSGSPDIRGGYAFAHQPAYSSSRPINESFVATATATNNRVTFDQVTATNVRALYAGVAEATTERSKTTTAQASDNTLEIKNCSSFGFSGLISAANVTASNEAYNNSGVPSAEASNNQLTIENSTLTGGWG